MSEPFPQRTWTPEKESLLLEKVNAQKGKGTIAQELGLTKNQVSGKMNRMGLKVTRPPDELAVILTEKIKLLADNGKTMREAAQILDLSWMSISNYAKRYKIKFTPLKPLPTIKEEAKKKDPDSHISFHSPTQNQKRLEDIGVKDCHWPVTPGWWCGEKSEAGKSFCEKHLKIARRKI